MNGGVFLKPQLLHPGDSFVIFFLSWKCKVRLYRRGDSFASGWIGSSLESEIETLPLDLNRKGC